MLFDLVEESKKIIAIDSVSETGNRVLAQHLVPYCEKLGLHLNLQTAGNGHAEADVNLIAHTQLPGGDVCPGGIALVTHLDTVPAGDVSLWTETGGDPFRATVKGDRIYGLGSADTKLDFLCKLLALEEVDPRRLKVPVALVGTFGEERSLAGARLLQESGLMRPQFALVGEPSELRPVNAHKGMLYLKATWTSPPAPLLNQERVAAEGRRVRFLGRAAHGSMPHLGENAIIKAAQWLFGRLEKEPNLQLLKIHGGTVHNIVPERCEITLGSGAAACRRISFLKAFFQLMERAKKHLKTQENKAFDPPRTTSNVGVIRGDEGKIEIEFDFRLIPETDGNAVFEIFQALGREIPEARVEVIRSNTPMATDPRSRMADHVSHALIGAGLPVRFWAKAGNTEGAVFNAMGAETIVIGPGKSVGNIHAPNEYNEISQLKKAVAFYSTFLNRFC